MKKRLVVASSNMGKLREIREILADLDLEIVSMKEAGIDVEIIEDGKSFEENSAIKAGTVARAGNIMAIADDSGLVIDALGGKPGIYSARFMGDSSYDEKNDELIRQVNEYCLSKEESIKSREMAENQKPASDEAGKPLGILKDGPDEAGNPVENMKPGSDETGNPGPLRSARFVCAVTVAWPDGRLISTKGVMEGRIGYERKGENGFGYDPIFFLPEYGMTSAQISPEEKNRISHRGQAFRAMIELLKESVDKEQ